MRRETKNPRRAWLVPVGSGGVAAVFDEKEKAVVPYPGEVRDGLAWLRKLRESNGLRGPASADATPFDFEQALAALDRVVRWDPHKFTIARCDFAPCLVHVVAEFDDSRLRVLSWCNEERAVAVREWLEVAFRLPLSSLGLADPTVARLVPGDRPGSVRIETSVGAPDDLPSRFDPIVGLAELLLYRLRSGAVAPNPAVDRGRSAAFERAIAIVDGVPPREFVVRGDSEERFTVELYAVGIVRTVGILPTKSDAEALATSLRVAYGLGVSR